MSIPFKSAPFKTNLGTTARTMDKWFSDVINVYEFANLHVGGSGLGTYTGNDAPCIQAALDAAFGSPSSPHGYSSRHLNRPVFLPAGRYRITDKLNLKYVVGGMIYGAGTWATQIHLEAPAAPGGGVLWPLLDINGAANLTIKGISMQHHGLGGIMTGLNSCCVNLDWDGTGLGTANDGLHGNHFQDLNLGGGNHVVIIANSGNGGADNLFTNCTVNGGNDAAPNGNVTGYDVRGPAALNNKSILGGGGAEVAWMRCPTGGGSMSADGPSIPTHSGSDANFVMESGQVMVISGGRTENTKLLRMTNGIVTVQGIACTLGPTTDYVKINGGKCIFQGAPLMNGKISGTGGELYISGVYVEAANTAPLSTYSGVKKWNPQGFV